MRRSSFINHLTSLSSRKRVYSIKARGLEQPTRFRSWIHQWRLKWQLLLQRSRAPQDLFQRTSTIQKSFTATRELFLLLETHILEKSWWTFLWRINKMLWAKLAPTSIGKPVVTLCWAISKAVQLPKMTKNSTSRLKTSTVKGEVSCVACHKGVETWVTLKKPLDSKRKCLRQLMVPVNGLGKCLRLGNLKMVILLMRGMPKGTRGWCLPE